MRAPLRRHIYQALQWHLMTSSLTSNAVMDDQITSEVPISISNAQKAPVTPGCLNAHRLEPLRLTVLLSYWYVASPGENRLRPL